MAGGSSANVSKLSTTRTGDWDTTWVEQQKQSPSPSTGETGPAGDGGIGWESPVSTGGSSGIDSAAHKEGIPRSTHTSSNSMIAAVRARIFPMILGLLYHDDLTTLLYAGALPASPREKALAYSVRPSMMISTRRFFCRPAAVRFEAIGRDSPKPRIDIMAGEICAFFSGWETVV